MIAGIDHPRGVAEAVRLQRLQDLADIVVEERDHAVIGGDGDAAMIVVAEEVVVILDAAKRLQHGVLRPRLCLALDRPGHGVRRVHVEEFLWRAQREVRTDERYEQHPRLVGVLRGLLLHPAAGFGRNRPIVFGVRRLAAARLFRQQPRVRAGWWRPPHQADGVTDAIEHVHGQQFFIETVWVVAIPIVQLADRRHPVPVRHQAMAPARHPAVVGMTIVPVAALMHVAPCRE